MTGSANDLAMLGQVMGGLIVVIVLIGLIAKVARRTRGQRGGSGLRIIDRIGLSREANLAVVEVSNRLLLLGVTARGVTMLATLDDDGVRGPGTGEVGDPALDHLDAVDSISDLTVTHTIRPAGRRRRSGLVELGLVVEEPVAEAMDDGLVDVVGSDRGRLADWGQPIPAEIALDEYPDLAAALRAAGRTAEPVTDDLDSQTSQDGQTSQDSPATEAPVGPEVLPPPRTRAEARARRAAADAAGSRTIPAQASEADQILAPTPARPRVPAPTPARPWIPTSAPARPRIPAPTSARAQSAVARTEPTRAESARAEPTRTMPTRTEPTRTEPTRTEPTPTGPGRTGRTPTSAKPRIPAPRPEPTPSPRNTPTVQASGSVLSPKTWRQGIDALRELTVRRG